MRAAAVTGLPEQAYAHLAVYDTALAHRRLSHADTNIIKATVKKVRGLENLNLAGS